MGGWVGEALRLLNVCLCLCVYSESTRHKAGSDSRLPGAGPHCLAWQEALRGGLGWHSPRDMPSTGFWASSAHTVKQGGDSQLPAHQEGPWGASLGDTSGGLKHTQCSPLCPLGSETPIPNTILVAEAPAYTARPDHRPLARLTSGPLATQVYSTQTRTSRLL